MSSLDPIINGLNTSRGIEYNQWVARAFNFLFFNAHVIEETQAESDVIAEAFFSEEPYYLVIEAQALSDPNEIGYDKLGQIRGNFQSYMTDQRQRVFKNAYKLIVGKPKFSKDAKKRSEPDVLLLRNDVLIQILNYHNIFSFSQDFLEILFRRDNKSTFGEIDETIVNKLIWFPYKKRVDINALVLYCLGINGNKREWIPIQQVIGMAKVYAKVLHLDIEDFELAESLNDLQGMFFKLIDKRDDKIRLNSIPLNEIKNISRSANELVSNLSRITEMLDRIGK
jgi:hypothetical protein